MSEGDEQAIDRKAIWDVIDRLRWVCAGIGPASVYDWQARKILTELERMPGELERAMAAPARTRFDEARR